MAQFNGSSLVEILKCGKAITSTVLPIFTQLEQDQPCNLDLQVDQLEAVWELRWSSSSLPYLQVQPWFENLQILLPREGRAMNLLRLPAPFGQLGGISVLAELQIEAPSRVGVRFIKGGWIGPQLAPFRPQLLAGINQNFPAWLDITHLSDDLRLCRGSNGTMFALIRRTDLNPHELMPSL